MFKSLIILVLAAILQACVVTPDVKFADTLDQVRATENINVIIDSFIATDIQGKSLGYNSRLNNARATELKDTVVSILQEKGYKPNIVFLGSGFQQDIFNQTDVFYSADWVSTGKKFSEAVAIEGNSEWANENMSGFFDVVLTEARDVGWTPPKYDLSTNGEKETRNARLGRLPGQKEARTIALQNPPEVIGNTGSDKFLVVKYGNVDMSTGKKFGIGLLSGALSLAASGGSTIGILTFSEKGPIEVALFDVSSQQILWAHESTDTSRFSTEAEKMIFMLETFPAR